MDVNSRKAPKRSVVEISKHGSWGNYEYWHKLECGHTEIRKRAAPTDKIACRPCVQAKEKGKELQSLVVSPQRAVFDDDFFPLEDDQQVEIEAGSLRGALASVLQIPLEAIDVVIADIDGQLTVSSVIVFLSANDAYRISKKV